MYKWKKVNEWKVYQWKVYELKIAWNERQRWKIPRKEKTRQVEHRKVALSDSKCTWSDAT